MAPKKLALSPSKKMHIMADSMSTSLRVISILASIAGIIFWIFVWRYLRNLETIGCECAETRARKFLFAFTGVIIVALLCLMVIMATDTAKYFSKPIILVGILMIICEFIYAVVGIRYVNYVRRIKCECAKSRVQSIWYIFLIIMVVFVSMFFLEIIALVIMIVVAMIKSKQAYSMVSR